MNSCDFNGSKLRLRQLVKNDNEINEYKMNLVDICNELRIDAIIDIISLDKCKSTLYKELKLKYKSIDEINTFNVFND